jgi:hypothetical protein
MPTFQFSPSIRDTETVTGRCCNTRNTQEMAHASSATAGLGWIT